MSEQPTPRVVDRGGSPYWDRFWRRRRPTGLARRASYFHRRLVAWLASYATPGTVVLEAGCGGSVWLPALALRGAICWGVDYSRVGLALLEQTLEHQHVTATLIAGNVLDPEALPAGRFDVIYSVGLVEHFAPPDDMLLSFRRLLVPGGVLITLVPNFTSVWGRLQCWVDRPVYDTHVVYSPERLDQVHRRAGYSVIEAGHFFGGFAPLVVNAGGPMSRLPVPVGAAAIGSVWLVQQAVAWSTHALGLPTDSSVRSGYVGGVYRAESPGPFA